jgi:hypothetical protein
MNNNFFTTINNFKIIVEGIKVTKFTNKLTSAFKRSVIEVVNKVHSDSFYIFGFYRFFHQRIRLNTPDITRGMLTKNNVYPRPLPATCPGYPGENKISKNVVPIPVIISSEPPINVCHFAMINEISGKGTKKIKE